jgi:peroxiredoxin
VAQPEAALFDFQPPSSARQIANVSLPSERNVSLVGTSAADFTLKTLDGETVHLSELHGKVVLLDFWASWCPPCRHELPTIAGLSRKLKDTNVVIFGINDEDGSKAKHFLETNHNELVTLHDGDRKVARMYSCYSIPTVFIIDPAGRIVGHYVGERDEQEFMASLREAGMK